jgi:type II secretory pathway pseudopilin PulG
MLVMMQSCQRAVGLALFGRRGVTLLELMIILTVVVVLIFIALPTLRPTEQESNVELAKERLHYLYNQEQQYFNLHGEYAPLPMLAEDDKLGAAFDQRFASTEALVEGVKYKGPDTTGPIFSIIATFSDGTRYKVDQLGQVVPMQ